MEALKRFMRRVYHRPGATATCDSPPMPSTIRAYLTGREAAMLAAIERLVSVNSYTENAPAEPAWASCSRPSSARSRASPSAAVPSARFAPHLVAATRAAEASADGCVAIVGHLDTVFPPGTFEGFRRDGALARGPGVLDMKGGLVLAIEALRALAAAGVLARARVRFVIVSDEEVGSPEGQAILRREIAGAACALVLEAGRARDAVITARKGTGGVRVTATGKAAHAGNAHDKGANAIWALARFIDRAQALTDYARGVTVNTGTVSGGQSKNTVPDHALAALDFRFERVADGEATMAALRAAAADAAASVPGTSLAVEGGLAACPSSAPTPTSRSTASTPATRARSGWATARPRCSAAAPTRARRRRWGSRSIDGLGPRGSGFHTKDELIEVGTLVPKAEAMAAFIAARAASEG